MTLKSALEDLSSTTLAAVVGLLGKLRYLASLRRGGEGYRHWGMGQVHGEDASDRAFRTAHGRVFRSVLRSPLAVLVEDLQDSSRDTGRTPAGYLEEVGKEEVVPLRSDPASVSHFNAVMIALSNLVKVQSWSSRSDASPRRPPGRAPLLPEDDEGPEPALAREDAAGG